LEGARKATDRPPVRTAAQPTAPHRNPTKPEPGTLSGVIGVAVTGQILEAAGGAAAKAGWYQAHTLAAAICVKAATTFAVFARGERLFD
jgi:hypothetical protein